MTMVKNRVDQNIISFQNDPGRLLFILTDSNWSGKTNFGGHHGLFNNKILSVLSAGMFFVSASWSFDLSLNRK
jgi:hypothetical protein